MIVSGQAFSVMAEPILFNVLLSNILTNSLKYRCPDQRLEVRIHLENNAESGRRITISDTGVGFDEDKAEEIFMPFKTLKHKANGGGIGLATCRENCRRHGWDISASSERASGPTIVIDVDDRSHRDH